MNKLEIIKHYQTILFCEQFILTGSTALQFHGLVETSSDVDIILVNPTEECKNLLEKLQVKSDFQDIYKGRLAYMFEHDGTKIDIFIETSKLTCPSYEGVFINPVNRIIAAKKKSARLKDFAQLRKIASSILTDKELMSYIDSKA